VNDKQRFSSVWDAIEDTPRQATSMRARSELMMNLTEVIRERGMTQGDAAALFGVTRPRVYELIRGKIDLFSLDTLIDMAAKAGQTCEHTGGCGGLINFHPSWAREPKSGALSL